MKKAFTLIELLIVVAIIAILAAIAVPNFLEAQTRAKVSRVQSDQRTYATALETYYIDNNSYPVYFSTGMGVGTAQGYPYNTAPTAVVNFNRALYAQGGGGGTNPYENIPTFAVPTTANHGVGLTTPVSYLSTYVPDAFAVYKGATFSYAQGAAGYLLWSPGADGADQLDEGNQAEIILKGGQSLPSPYLITGPLGNAPKPAGAPGGATMAFTYDPTNGTGSTGDVYRTK